MNRYAILEMNGDGQWVEISSAATARLACDAIDAIASMRVGRNLGAVRARFGVQEHGQAVREYGRAI